jgi:large subunit ribosomal protein L17
MRHLKKGRKLGRTSAHRKSLLANLSTSLILHERIVTTEAKAKEMRSTIEPLITLARKAVAEPASSLHCLRQAGRVIRHQEALFKLINELGPRFQSRNGGYTRILHVGPRSGDNAPMCLIEFVDSDESAATVQDNSAELAEA